MPIELYCIPLSQRLRILHICPSYKPAFCYGGPTFSVSRLAEKQAELGAEVWVFTTTANGAEELDVPTDEPIAMDGVQVVYYRRWTGDHTHICPGLWWALWRQGGRFDVIHVHSWWNWVALIAVLVCRWRGFRTVFSPHGMLSTYSLRSWWRRGFQHIIGRWMLARAQWHATSLFEYRELRALVPDSSMHLLPNVVPFPDEAALPPARPGGPVRLLFLSRIEPKKGLDFLLEALSGLEARLDWQLLIAGDANSPYGHKMRDLAGKKDLQSRVQWLGWVSGEVKWQLLAEADVLLLPSLNENFALVILEALAVGTTVVVSDQVGLADYVREKDLGWCVPLQIILWRRALEAAIEDVPRRRRIREQAPVLVRRDFDATAIAQQYLSAYTRPVVQVIFRKPISGGHYSIERSFSALWSFWSASDVLVQKVEACALSRGGWSRLRIARQMLRLWADVFHVSGDIHFAALFLPGRKTVLTIHDCGFLRHPNPWKRHVLRWLWLRWPVRHCRQVVAVSEATKADIVCHTGCEPSKIAVIPSVIPPHFKPVPKAFQAECPRILHIGSAPNKNLSRHIEALQGIPCVLHIVGCLSAEAQQQLERFGIAYECTSHLDDEAVVGAYASCDLLLFASTWEGFGMPILEAQATGRPVVTSRTSSMPEVAGEGACLVDPWDVADIRRGVLRVINDAAYRAHLIEKGFENARRYQPAAAAQAYEALYCAIAQEATASEVRQAIPRVPAQANGE